MNNFEYKNTVKIIFGKGTIPKVAGEIPKGSKVLMIYGGGSIKRNGIYDQVTTALKNFEVHEFSGIEPNPHYETCVEAMKVVNDKNIDFILAVGGGSVIDAAKFIAAGALYKGDDPWDFFTKRYLVIPKDAVPLGVVLTLPATGSEMNWTSVISRVSTSEKLAFGSPFMWPRFSVMDPECVYSLPDRQVANGIADAFVHVIEQYLTYPVNAPLQDRFSEGIMLTLIEEAPKIMADRNDYDAAANFTWCATMALNGLIGAGVPTDWSTHQIGHELTAFHGIDHARTLAIVLPGIMNLKRESKKEKILQYGERIWEITQGTDDERIDKAIEKTVEFFESLGIDCKLSDYGVTVETIDKIKERFKKRNAKHGEWRDIDYIQTEAVLLDRL